MLSFLSYLLVLPAAAALAYEDFRTRRVSLAGLVALAGACILAGIHTSGGLATLRHAVAGIVLTGLFVGALALWRKLRKGSFRDFFAHAFGAGDLLTMLAATPLFAPTAYVRFLLAASVAGVVWGVLRGASTIPLAGFMALSLAGHALYKIAVLWS